MDLARTGLTAQGTLLFPAEMSVAAPSWPRASALVALLVAFLAVARHLLVS